MQQYIRLQNIFIKSYIFIYMDLGGFMINRYAFIAERAKVLLFSVIFSVAALITASNVEANSFLTESDTDFFIQSRGISVKKLLIEFGSSYHVPVIISEKINGVFVGSIKGKTSVQILDQLSRTFNLAWYYDGHSLYVSSANEVVSKLIVPTFIEVEELHKNLAASVNTSSPFNKLELIASSKSIKVSGVPQFVDEVVKVAETMDKLLHQQADEKIIIKVFPLNHASASDTTYSYRDQNIVIPGVVRELNDTLGGTGAIGGSKSGDKGVLPGSGAANGSAESPGLGAAGSAGAGRTSLPRITADSRHNAITIMGQASKMPMYEDLIKQLDKPQQPINISVNIIDVQSGNLNSLGVDWAAAAAIGSGGKISFNNGEVSASGSVSAVIKRFHKFFNSGECIKKSG